MQLCKCFAVSPMRSACLAMHQTAIKTKGWQFQRACKTKWLLSEATVRATSEILAIWAALKQLSENKNDGNVRCFTLTYENKKFKFTLALPINYIYICKSFSGLSHVFVNKFSDIYLTRNSFVPLLIKLLSSIKTIVPILVDTSL